MASCEQELQRSYATVARPLDQEQDDLGRIGLDSLDTTSTSDTVELSETQTASPGGNGRVRPRSSSPCYSPPRLRRQRRTSPNNSQDHGAAINNVNASLMSQQKRPVNPWPYLSQWLEKHANELISFNEACNIHNANIATISRRTIADHEGTPGSSGKSSSTGSHNSRNRLRQQSVGEALGPSQAALDVHIIRFVVANMMPLRIVDSEEFRALMGCCLEGYSKKLLIPSRRKFGKMIFDHYKNVEGDLKSMLSGLNYVSTTADVWTANKKSYLGMTCHWLEKTTRKRRMAILACERLYGRHTFQVLADAIEAIHTRFGIHPDKITMTTTDNAANFKKSFLVYGRGLGGSCDDGEANAPTAASTPARPKNSTVSTSSTMPRRTRQQHQAHQQDSMQLDDDPVHLEDEDPNARPSGDDEDEEAAMDHLTVQLLTNAERNQNAELRGLTVQFPSEDMLPAEFEATDISDILRTQQMEDGEDGTDDAARLLSRQMPCAAHTLNLVASVDCDRGVKDLPLPGYKKVSRSAFSKASALWNKQGTSTGFADSLQEKLGHRLPVPCSTRWNSIYDAVKKINASLEKKKAELATVIQEFNAKSTESKKLQMFTSSEIELLREYEKVMAPVAEALDYIQGESKAYLGCLIPTITTLLLRLQEVKRTGGTQVSTQSPSVSPAGPAQGVGLRYAEPLVDILIDAVQKRFKRTFGDEECLLATAFHPLFRLEWTQILGSQFQIKVDKTKVQTLMEQKVEDYLRKQDDHVRSYSYSSGEEMTDLETGRRDFVSMCLAPGTRGSEESRRTPKTQANKLVKVWSEGKATHSLSDEVFSNEPVLIDLFVRYNTGMPSSAPVERLFSMAKDVTRAKRNKLSDSNVNILLFLQGNFVKSRGGKPQKSQDKERNTSSDGTSTSAAEKVTRRLELDES